MKDDRVMTTRELAGYMKLNEKTILKMAQNKELPGVKIGSQWRFHLETVDQYLQNDIVLETPKDELDIIIRTTDQIIPLSRLVSPDLMRLDFKAKNKKGVLVELAEVADEAGILSDRTKLVDQLEKREKMFSTAVGNGIAIPHPRHPDPKLFARPNIVVGRSKQGVDFSSPDGEKVHLFFMTCAPTIFVHLRLLAKIAKLLQVEGVIDKFMQASGSDEIIQLLLELERKHLFPWEVGREGVSQ